MSNPIKQFYETLFEPGEGVCWSPDPYGIRIYPIDHFPLMTGGKQCFFAINPMRDRRLDSNVTAYRNILIEFDDIPPHEQLQLITDIPHSTLVWSGGKSYHTIISMEDPCADRYSYDKLVRRIYERIPQCDRQVKNPSRFSRSPGAARGELLQELVHVKTRVSTDYLENWLGPEAAIEPKNGTASKRLGGLLRGATQYFLAHGAEDGQWNRSLFLAVLDMSRAGHSSDHIWFCMESITGHLTPSDKRTITSAIKIASEE